MAENVTFPFPFKPYDVQEAFMKNLYNVLDKSQIGIFESPTGTGKSLSIICGALKWLKDYQTKQRKDLEQLISEKTENTEDDWFNSFLEKHEKNKKILDAKEEYKFLTEYEEKIKRLKNSKDIKKYEMKQILPHAKRRKEMDEKEENKQMEEDFVAEEYDSDDDDKEATKEEKRHVLKIYYASRTHSQLAQFLGEIQRSPYSDKVTVTTLGSRANFCINKSVLKLKNLSLINEQCVDMQKTKNSNKKCPFFKNLSDLQDNVLAAVRDIEDIVQLGQELKSCPYYATRHAIPDAEIVLLPYNVLLHKPTRDAYGIILKDNILIIDEAHNLVEAVNSMYSAEISGLLLKQTLWQMQSYLSAYQTRFSQETKRLIKLILQLCDAFVKFLSDPCNKISRIIPVMEFITLSDIGNINIFELVKYIENSLICQKVHGFTASRVAKGLTPLDDRKKCDKPKNWEARSIVLFGDYAPFFCFPNNLFKTRGVSPERISHFFPCAVIPPENLLAIGLASGPCGNLLDFTFKSRQLPETVKELGSILFNVTNIIRGGIVCFFPP
ncbi:ATP-dependent DNA helicase DDX11 like protein [Argiope bruennichi]|uniref:ATP-dependent DNA helicase DDX11 like protein n=1 Tax=Argiope bruennichi TaxID=94029 RepID=A0A8T0EDT2_ARGBR|nr:ATP-dependent DNA helicase DDX11 like protein [Argiope bruennichi]